MRSLAYLLSREELHALFRVAHSLWASGHSKHHLPPILPWWLFSPNKYFLKAFTEWMLPVKTEYYKYLNFFQINLYKMIKYKIFSLYFFYYSDILKSMSQWLHASFLCRFSCYLLRREKCWKKNQKKKWS